MATKFTCKVYLQSLHTKLPTKFVNKVCLHYLPILAYKAEHKVFLQVCILSLPTRFPIKLAYKVCLQSLTAKIVISLPTNFNYKALATNGNTHKSMLFETVHHYCITLHIWRSIAIRLVVLPPLPSGRVRPGVSCLNPCGGIDPLGMCRIFHGPRLSVNFPPLVSPGSFAACWRQANVILQANLSWLLDFIGCSCVM